MKSIQFKYWLFLLILCVLSFGLIFQQQELLWDDYVLFHQPLSSIKQLYIDHGSYYFGIAHLINACNQIFPSILWVRIFQIVLYFVTCYLFIRILQERYAFKSHELFLIGLFFLLLPTFQIRSFFNVLIYNINLFTFTLAAWFYNRNKTTPALILFLISFITNSFIPLFLFLFLVFNYQDVVKKLPHLLIVPLFWMYKMMVAQSGGLFLAEQYNQVTKEGLIQAIFLFDDWIQQGWMNYKAYFMGLESTKWVAFLLLLAFIFLFLFKYKIESSAGWNKLTWMLVLSVGLIYIAVFPYAAVNKLPVGLFYDSRHQLLLNFGFALFLYSLYALLNRISPIVANAYCSAILAIFVLLNFAFQRDILINSKEQIRVFNYIQHYFKNEQTVFMKVKCVSPHFYDLNVWRYYEAGAYNKAHGKMANKIIYYSDQPPLEEIISLKPYRHLHLDDFNALDYTVDSVQVDFDRKKTIF